MDAAEAAEISIEMEAHAEAWHLAREALARQKQEHLMEVQTVQDAWQQALQEVARLSNPKLSNNTLPGGELQPLTSPAPSSAAPAQSPAGAGAWGGEGGGEAGAGAGAGGEKGRDGGEEGEGEGRPAEACSACSGNTFSKVLNIVT
jgi:hypothetical protein